LATRFAEQRLDDQNPRVVKGRSLVDVRPFDEQIVASQVNERHVNERDVEPLHVILVEFVRCTDVDVVERDLLDVQRERVPSTMRIVVAVVLFDTRVKLV
jgi:hypothetical protein